MADTKISALPASTTPLAGTEELPIVQSGVTRKVSVANLTAGRAISATELTLSTGNLIVGNGNGVNFSATPGTGTSELLNDYEEGTWTPFLASSGTIDVTYSAQTGKYTKIGRCVLVSGYLTVGVVTTNTGLYLRIEGLPFSSLSGSDAQSGSPGIYQNFSGLVAGDNIKFNIDGAAAGMYKMNANGSFADYMQGSNIQAGTSMYFSFSYQTP
jgi:hypothetical protein